MPFRGPYKPVEAFLWWGGNFSPFFSNRRVRAKISLAVNRPDVKGSRASQSVADALGGGVDLTGQRDGRGEPMKEINDTWYTIIQYDGEMIETDDKNEARLAVREGLEVTKNSRRVFSSGNSDIRLYVSTEILKIKDL